ncbi:hypothetical protein GCM10028801_06850 [Nocardioides maradonensis]
MPAKSKPNLELVHDAEDLSDYVPSDLTHEFVPDFDLTRVNPNPYNVRDRAIADDELIESIREVGLVEPLVVAPAILDDGKTAPAGSHDLVAGHRRLDGLLRIGATTAPVIIRHDLDTRAKQLEAMIVENDRRQGLTPIEQAKGYHQLTLFGVKQAEIAKKVGVDRRTVASRLKLLNLNTNVQTRVNDGQVTIDDAIAIAALPAAEQTKLAKTAGTYSFKHDLEAAKRRVTKTAEVDAKIAELKAAGIPERKYPDGVTMWNVNHADHGMSRLFHTFSNMPEDHDGCLAWIKATGPDIDYVCTDIAKHDEQLDEQRRAEREEAEKEAQEARAHREALDIAQRLRTDAVLESIRPGVRLDPAVDRILRLLLRGMLLELGWSTKEYFAALDLPAEQRWSEYSSQWKDTDIERFTAHIDAAKKPADILRLLAAIAISRAEGSWFSFIQPNKGPRSTHAEQCHLLARAYLQLAQDAGHELSPVEIELTTPQTEDGE